MKQKTGLHINNATDIRKILWRSWKRSLYTLYIECYK